MKDEKKAPLTLQVLKSDKDKGITIENHDMYKGLNELIQNNPDIGVKNDFGVFSTGTYSDSKQTYYIFLGVNRTNATFKNVQFKLSMGSKDGKMILDNVPIQLTEQEAGEIPPNVAVPIIVPENPKIAEQLDQLTKNNTIIQLNDTKYETAK